MKYIALLLCCWSAFGQIVIPGSSGGGGAPSGPAGCVQTYATSNSFGCGNIFYYPTGIPDPAPPVVSTVGATDATTYQYAIMLNIGGLGDGVTAPGIGSPMYSPTAPVASATFTGNSVLSMSNYNHIVMPNETDPNIQCAIFRTTGPQSPQIVYEGGCGPAGGPNSDGTFDDQANGAMTANVVFLGVNITAGTVVYVNPITGPPGYVIAGYQPQSQIPAPELDVPAAFGSSNNRFSTCADGNQNPGWVATAYAGSCTQGPWWDISAAGSAWMVTLVTHADSPYQVTRANGFLRTDTSAGAVTYNLPDPTAADSASQNTPIGRIYTFKHATSDVNPITIIPPMGFTINGQSSFVLSCPGGSVTVYGEGFGGTGGNYPTSQKEPWCGSAALGGHALLAGACDTPVSITITGARVGMGLGFPAPEADDTGDPSSFVKARISANDTVVAKVCTVLAGTPTSLTYDFRVIQ